ncbi:hypothetical protein K0U00_37445, partial [Paenibacillus sepulcri]|nr:hypothetical protein [Paenibacillus sepulcri]
MPAGPQLILDAGGVLVTNLSPLLWQQLAAEAAVSHDQLVESYKRCIREDLWNGKAGEASFWNWLQVQFPALREDRARELLIANLQPLPALQLIPYWSKFFDIHLLSNHRAEWLLPVLSHVRHCLTSMTISSEFGSCKPGPAIFAQAASLLPPGSPTLYVDDQQ